LVIPIPGKEGSGTPCLDRLSEKELRNGVPSNSVKKYSRLHVNVNVHMHVQKS